MIVAFSMYSKIPMPKIEWNKKNMKYALCFFPIVGVVIGAVMYVMMWLANQYRIGNLLLSCILVSVPVLMTGGIHLDGYLDTIDALSSYADREKRLEILKDSNSGAFAIIFGIIYFVLSIGVWSELSWKAMPFVWISYIMSRTLSGFSIASFPLAKSTGLAAVFQDGAHKTNVKIIMSIYLIAEVIILLYMNIFLGTVVIIASLLAFAYHYYVCKKIFGGITGDLAGYFLQICELTVAAALMIVCKIVY